MSATGRYNFPAFAAIVVEHCRTLWPDAEITTEGRSVNVLRPKDLLATGDWMEIKLNIGRAYREYWAGGDTAPVLEKMFSMLTNPPITRDEIEQRAMLKFDHFKINQDRKRLHWPVAANPQGVIITGVLDYPGNMHFFEEDDDGKLTQLTQHGVSPEQFWEWGMAHLRALVATFTPQHLEFKEDWPGHELWVLDNGSGYASAALLCHDIVDSWMPPALRGYKWRAGIPHRDVLVVSRLDTPDELLANAMVHGYKTALYPFDWTIYQVEQGQLVNSWGAMPQAEMKRRARDLAEAVRAAERHAARKHREN